MTQIDVLKMAIEAGLAGETSDGLHQIWYPDNLYHFAKLVAEQAHEAYVQASVCVHGEFANTRSFGMTDEEVEKIIKRNMNLQINLAGIRADFEEALAQPEQEPVAWMDADGNVSDNNDHKCFPIPLFTTPPQRTWVGLTDEEIGTIAYNVNPLDGIRQFSRAIEAKLKEKNT